MPAQARSRRRNSAASFLENIAEKQIEVLQFRDGYFCSRAPRSGTAWKPSNASSIAKPDSLCTATPIRRFVPLERAQIRRRIETIGHDLSRRASPCNCQPPYHQRLRVDLLSRETDARSWSPGTFCGVSVVL